MVDFLPQVFAVVNENFMSVAVEGVLQMLRGETSVDLEALRWVGTSCERTVLLAPRDVKKVVRTIAKEWWRLFGYKAVVSVTETKLREVSFCCFVLSL